MSMKDAELHNLFSYWVDAAAYDFRVMQKLYKDKEYAYALFLAI